MLLFASLTIRTDSASPASSAGLQNQTHTPAIGLLGAFPAPRIGEGKIRFDLHRQIISESWVGLITASSTPPKSL